MRPAWRGWLLSDTPASRRQAAAGRWYRDWLALRRNPLAMVGLAIVLGLVLTALLGPLLPLHPPNEPNLPGRLQPPGGTHWLGTDELGRDILSRLIHGAGATLTIVVLVAVIVVPIGLAIGTVAGYLGGWVDAVLMRITDIFLAFPRLVLALAFVAALRPGIENAIIAIALTSWPPYARLARAETLALRNAAFIKAAELQGAGALHVLRHHVVPLCLASVVVRLTLDVAGIRLPAAGLGSLGLGAQPRAAEWGAMISTGREYLLDQWWVATMPGIAIFLVSLGFNLLGDGLRDLMEPKR